MNATDWTRPRVLIAHSKMAPKLVPHIDAEVPVLCAETITDLPEDVRAGVDVMVGHQFPPGVLAQLPNLRWLHLTGTGTEHLPAAGLAPGVLVTSSARSTRQHLPLLYLRPHSGNRDVERLGVGEVACKFLARELVMVTWATMQAFTLAAI